MEKLEFNIPKGYVIDKEKSTDTKLVFQTKVDFSIHNSTDWFFVKTDSLYLYRWIIRGQGLPWEAHESNIHYSIETTELFTKRKICKKEAVTEFRKATDEEIYKLYSHHPCLKDNPKWGDFGLVSGYYVSSLCGIETIIDSDTSNREHNKNTFPSKKEAEACLALSQLLQWRDKYNGEPVEKWCDWNNEFQVKYCIKYIENKLQSVCFHTIQYPLCFKSSFLRDKFIENFKELIEIAKPLL